MTTPNDAARPINGAIFRDGSVSLVPDGSEDSWVARRDAQRVYTAADYDALRAENTKLARQIDAVLADNAKFFASMEGAHREQQKLRTRAEAAEAKVTKALNLTDTWRRAAHELRYNPAAMPYAADRIEECAKQLDAALNEGGE